MTSSASLTRNAAHSRMTVSARLASAYRIRARGSDGGLSLRTRQITGGKCPDVGVDARQFLRIGEEYDSEEALLRRHAETRSVHAENARLAEQREDELLVGMTCRQRDRGQHVERGARCNATHAWNGVQ